MTPEALGLYSILKTDRKDCPVDAGCVQFGHRREESVREGCSSHGHGKHMSFKFGTV